MEKPVPRPGLIATILILVAAAFLVRPLMKPPQLQEGRVLAGPPAWTEAAADGESDGESDGKAAPPPQAATKSEAAIARAAMGRRTERREDGTTGSKTS